MALCISDEAELLSAIAVLLNNDLSVILIEPGIDSQSMDRIVENYQVTLVITAMKNLYKGPCPCMTFPEKSIYRN